LRNFGKELAAEHVDKFIDRQELAAVAMKATGREMDAVNAQVNAYQREIERLIKSGLDPQDAALQKLQSEYAALLIKQDEAAQAAKAEAAAEKQKAAELEKAAKKTVELLDANTDYEKKSIELKHAQAELKEEMERLIKQGIDPESEQVKNLEGKYRELTKEVEANEMAHKAQEAAVKAAKGALLGISAAIAAGAAITVKAAAANEDMIASFVPMMNGNVDKATRLFKAIQKEAAATPFEIDKIAKSVRTLMPAFAGSADAAKDAFLMLGDTAQGSSQKLETITNAYTKAMLKGKVSMMEINQIANAGVPIYTELAKSMGVTEAQMMEMSKRGQITSDDLTGAFRQMTSEGGIFFKGMETSSDTFNMRLLGIKENLGILAGVIGERLLPVAKNIAGAVLNAVQSFTAWIQEGDNLRNMADTLIYVLAGLTAGLTTFMIVAKGSAIIHGLATAFRALTAAIAANPIGIIAVAITTVVIPALIALYRNWDLVQTYLEQGVARLNYAFKFFTQAFSGGFETSFDAIKIAGARWLSWWFDSVTVVLRGLLNIMSRLPGELGNVFGDALGAINNLRGSIRGLTDVAIASSSDRTRAIMAELDAELAGIDTAAQARRDELEARRRQMSEELQANAETGLALIELTEETEAAITAAKLASLRERLNAVALTERQALNEQTSVVAQFLQQRADLEGVYGQDRIQFYETQKEILLNIFTAEGQEREAIAAAIAASILETENKLNEEAVKAAREAEKEKLRLAKEASEEFKRQVESIIPVDRRIQSERIEMVRSFLQQAADLETEDFAARIAFIEEQKRALLALYAEGSAERIAIEKAADKEIADSRRQWAEEEQRLLEQRLSAFSSFFNGISQLIKLAGEENRNVAIAAKALAMTEAGINTAVAATKALASSPPPFNYILMGGVIAAGVAEQIKIASAPIPSAETGGRFIVPDVSARRVDGVGMRVNPGEEINITPRGMSGGAGGETFNFQFVFNGQVFAEIINKLARAGELHTLQLAGNL